MNNQLYLTEQSNGRIWKMLNSHDWNKMGEEIRYAIEDSFKTGNFSRIGYLISDTIGDIFSYEKKENEPPQVEKDTQLEKRNFKKSVLSKKGSVSSIICMVLGGAGMLTSGTIFLVFSGITLLSGINVFDNAIPFIIFLFMICWGVVDYGLDQRRNIKRAERYIDLCDGQTYIDISNLSAQMGKSKKKVLKELKKLIAKGYFPQGHIDNQESCFIITDSTYREYMEIERQRSALNENQADKEKTSVNLEKENNCSPVDKLIIEGEEYLIKFSQVEEKMRSVSMNFRIHELESTLNQILDRLRQNPDEIGKMEKFMEYYLPMTLRLVEKYSEFDAIMTPSDDVKEAKEEIEKTIDTINIAFRDLYDKLFLEDVYDVTADAKVLKTMLEKEGFSDSPFK